MSDDRTTGISPDETLATSTADPVHNPAGDGVDVSDSAAAQGGTRTDMLKVLGASLLLVIVVLFGMYFFHLGPMNPSRGSGVPQGQTKQSQAQQFNEPAPAPKQAPVGSSETPTR